ncbi:unnamed protein product [Sphagnum compactum]
MCITIRPKEEILLEMEREPKHEQEEQEVGQQQQDSKESVRARLLAISQVQAPTSSSCEEVSSPLESVGISKGLKAVMPKLTPGGKDAADDEFRRKLMGMSYVEVESGTTGIEFLASIGKGYHATVLYSVLLMHWRLGGSSSSTSDFLVFHVMTDLSFFLNRKRKCTKREGQKKNWVIKFCISYKKTCVAHWKLTICSSLQAVSTIAGCQTT